MLQPTGNRIIDTFLFVAGSAIAFNIILPIFALVVEFVNKII